MGYTVTIPLLKKANKEAIMAAFKLFPYTSYNDYIWMSDDPEDHGYAKNLKNAIFYSYKCMPNDAHYYLWFFSSVMVSKFGLSKKCKLNDKSYPYFYYDGITVYVIPEDDRTDFDGSDIMFNVLQHVDNIDIHSHMSQDIKANYTKEQFDLLFGDNDLLKEHCKILSNVSDNIN